MINKPKTEAEAVAYWKSRTYGFSYMSTLCVYSVPEGGRSVGF